MKHMSERTPAECGYVRPVQKCSCDCQDGIVVMSSDSFERRCVDPRWRNSGIVERADGLWEVTCIRCSGSGQTFPSCPDCGMPFSATEWGFPQGDRFRCLNCGPSLAER